MENTKMNGIVEEVIASDTNSDNQEANFLSRLVDIVQEADQQQKTEKEKKAHQETTKKAAAALERPTTPRPEEAPRARYNLD